MGAMELVASLFPIGACIGTAVATAAYAARRAQTVDVLLSLLDGDDAGGAADGGGVSGGGADGRPPGVGAPLSLSAALAFPFIASAALLFMFFFYAGISALLAVVVTLSSAVALSYLFFPVLDVLIGRAGGGGWSRLPTAPAASPSSSALLGAGGAAAAGVAAGSSRRRGSGGGGGVGGGGSGSGSDGGRAAAVADAVATTSARCGAAAPPPSVVATGLLVAVALTGWLMTGHWALNNLLGVAQCVLFVSLVRVHAAVTSLRVCTLLLAGLFVYDVFWVFASAHLFGTNVMVAVATQDATNPVASAAAALHLPVAPVARLALPVKLVFPTGDGGGLMLGLGDIFVPGLLLGLVLAFDTTTAAAAATAVAGDPGGGGAAAATGATRRGGGAASAAGSTARRGCWPADGIFPLALLGYAAGLVCSFVANGVFGVAQPALLYLVPATIGPVVAATASRGDLGELWRGPVVYGAVPAGRVGLPAPATAIGDNGAAVC